MSVATRPPESLYDDRQLIDLEALDGALAAGERAGPLLRAALQEADETLAARFLEGTPAAVLVPLRAQVVDAVVRRLWQRCLGPLAAEATIAAVGGYGRGELHPGSDTDLMVLLPPDAGSRFDAALTDFVTVLWDVGLEVGHSVRTVDDCVRQAERDITVATNLMEARRIDGDAELFETMQAATGPARLWPSRAFFEAKWREQQARHEKYHDTAYNLEPNIKESPGGLRDIHMVGWVAKRHFNADSLQELIRHGFLTDAEHRLLMRGQHFLWDIRFALHVLAGRREDRLLFDHQTQLAEQFGYKDADHTLAVEQFMQRYYRTVMQLNRLNEMLLQLYQEAILYADVDEAPRLLNKRFQVKRGFIEVTHPNVFRRYPFALLEVFLLIQQHPEIKGVRAATVRLIRENRHRIDERFRRDLRAKSLFMEILRQPRGITHELRRMHTYGVLGRYIPAFGDITGRMQYDLFHAYTVDSHTLMVVRNLRRLTVPEHTHEFPHCSEIIRRIPKPELLYLAGLFHDIAKGRGGDHSELGAEDAYQFCLQHGLSRYDCRLVAWLVRHHLLMSMTAQRKDISDPQVVNEFARQMGDSQHLDYLYLLTVADIRGTNPKLWNSWREALLLELYRLTKRAIRRGLGNPIDEDELVRETQARARQLLKQHGLHHMTVRAIWRHFARDYFLRYAAEEIAWHTEAIHAAGAAPARPLVLIEPVSQRGGTEVFVYARDRDNIFALSVSALDQLGLDIQDARIITTENGYTLDSYLVLEEDGRPIERDWRRQEIEQHIADALSGPERLPEPSRRALPRRLRHFNTETQIEFGDDENNGRSAMELITGDQPGLLAQVGYVFARCGVRLQNAKIATIGERAEDVFFITDRDNQPLSGDLRQCVRRTLMELLDDEPDIMKRADGV
ncbi:[protein-PII] uridylyltransferase [Sediminicurvatus halobius]|uniref:Bifunctional uridylyltransferase/uridylyl-removing enzyme n=1 Tax=Sediminicurvatus halobius TaxID=2182432 RepID=A0A2U2N492_9GAMM|nr:[protein-PII] uridylyltransferase [Spiribacter halobius]PWG63903.1 [protein-PII] uridylyltransferase [Spiribacter halobius]UEX76315.1 [protein-PII] uridylyltransferase [Spiribacter halobius]